MNKPIDIYGMKYIIDSVLEYGYESIDDEKANSCEFNEGRKQAYYEVLDTIYSQLDTYKQNPKDFGYSDNWKQKFLS